MKCLVGLCPSPLLLLTAEQPFWAPYWFFSACSLMTAEVTETSWRLCRCGGCGAVFHAECRQKAQPCPRCVHRELHHKRPSSFWSADDDSFYLPYQDTWGTHRRARAVKAKAGSHAGISACFSDGGSEWFRRERLMLHQVRVHVFIHQPAEELLQQAVESLRLYRFTRFLVPHPPS